MGMQRNGALECSVCRSKVVAPSPRSVSRAYDKHRSKISHKYRALHFLLVSGDCILVGLQSRKQKVGEKPLLSLSTFMQAARNNVLLAIPALLYAINNYLKFIMQLYFNPATVKMLSNLKVLVIAVLLKIIMRRKFSIIQWEALALLLIGISVNQLRSVPEGTNSFGLPVTTIAYIYTLIFVTVPSLASVYNEYALKSQFDTSIYLQNLFLYGYGAIFNFLGILGTVVFQGPESFDILRDTILKKYSSTVATIFTGLASAVFLGQPLTVNFLLGISIVFISMHQFFSPLAKVQDEKPAGTVELEDTKDHRSMESSFVNMTAGAADNVSVSFLD
ncbi:hypothetical protein PR202_gb15205 [Eleusine coracana subsp. coracana]|uniref:CMP-sialic acid transporter 5 n=1 Tax=Eleusine coracana subsp. coracana TaxID=191504 RepID=A0AAV5EX78_ELECO|nr:hypothetical protein PR202_gb15205 [Eleusine coracana subsp. coracana]